MWENFRLLIGDKYKRLYRTDTNLPWKLFWMKLLVNQRIDSQTFAEGFMEELLGLIDAMLSERVPIV